MSTKFPVTTAEWIKRHPIKLYASGKWGWSKDSDIYPDKESARSDRKKAAKNYMRGN